MESFRLKSLSFLFLFIFVPAAQANLIVSVTDAPTAPASYFTGQLAGADENDPTPNPCYGINGCNLKFFVISEDWLPAGRDGYYTADNSGWFVNATPYKTLGEWVKATKEKGDLYRSAKDYLPGTAKKPCMVIAARTPGHGMLLNTIVSNCAKGIVHAPTCSIEPPQITVDFGELSSSQTSSVIASTPLSLSCISGGNVTIETNSKEIVPLNGSSVTVAELDWGKGFGNPGKFTLADNETRPLTLRTRLKGFTARDSGFYSGSAVVNIAYY